ncbi:MAG: hypothetical protein U1E36_02100 [Rickettsiales bacterium]
MFDGTSEIGKITVVGSTVDTGDFTFYVPPAPPVIYTNKSFQRKLESGYVA